MMDESGSSDTSETVYAEASNPIWLDATQTRLRLRVAYTGDLDLREVETDGQSDDVPAGRELWQRALAGEFGPIATAVPRAVTGAQARIALRRAGLRESVEDAVKSSGLDTQDWYAFATTWERESAILGGLAAGMGLSDAQLDDLFREAAAVS
jgi:hypothetical protein